ncbi:MAG: PKD domain-containing protein [Limisphaerales bacterium]
MKFYHQRLVAAGLALLVFKTSAAVLYVDLNSTNPTPPYANWSTAATNIQDAVDAASNGDEVLVTNGVYQTGGRVVYGSLTNRVVINKAVSVQSVNGPAVTIIQGIPAIGDSAVRCVYLTNHSVLSGFTLTNGGTRNAGDGDLEQSGGGAWCESTNAAVINCVLSGCSAAVYGGGVYQGTLSHCSLSNDMASAGGGASSSIVDDSILFNNSAGEGGGAVFSTLDHCTLANNSAGDGGGGANSSTLNNCLLSGNSAFESGGGIYASTANNSVFTNNYSNAGGGAGFSTVNNSAFTANTANWGGAAAGGTLDNCTMVGNSAGGYGGGGADCVMNNCIVYYNTSPDGPNFRFDGEIYGVMNFCCTTPMPPDGTNNIIAAPLMTDSAHLSTGSPCRGAGSAAYASGVDIDGEPWLNPPSIGCDEYYPGATGSLSVAAQANYTSVAAGFAVNFTGQIAGHATVSFWDFGDGTLVTNSLSVSHSWASAGDHAAVLWAYNDSYPGGTSATVMVQVIEGIYHVARDNPNPAAPYDSWATAATNIQDAVDVAIIGGTVLVSNGVYQTGGRPISLPDFGPIVTNRVIVTNLLTLKSVNGPAVTFIVGNQAPGTINDYGAVRGVYLANGATVSGFTITNGATGPGGSDAVWESWGGGLYCPSGNGVVTNCLFINNSAGDSGGGAQGGTYYNCQFIGNGTSGADSSTLNNCMFTGNTGYGAGYSTLNNCTVTGNSGVGVVASAQNNCIVYFNSAGNYQDGYYVPCTFNYSCTTPLPGNGTNNITTDPQLADFSHITAGSPCRAAGSTDYSTGMDIDNEVWASPPSMGCDEFHPGAITGPLAVAIQASYTNVARGFLVNFTGQISGHAGSNTWDFGDGTGVSNQLYPAHGWAALGDYPVILRAYNESNPDGVSATQVVHVLEAIHYVAPGNASPVSPYISWATAATNIQDAVDAAFPGGTILVTNGVYGDGGRVVYGILTNRVVINRLTPVTVESVNGPAATVIQGYQDPVTTTGDDAVRCVLLGNGSHLAGFTLSGGATRNDGDGVTEQSGGGLLCDSTGGVASNCVLTANSAAWVGGGASGGTLNNCTFAGNSASYGGGVYQSTLNSCTLFANSTAYYGGAAYNSLLANCVLSGNFAGGVGGAICYGTANNCTLAGSFTGDSGGAAYGATLNNCVLTSNSAFFNGGGAYSCFLTNCTLSGNSGYYGGGAENSTLQSCVLSSNTAALGGGGADSSTLNQCTLSGNSGSYGGGASGSTLNICTLSNNLAVLFHYEGGEGGGADYCNLANCLLTGNSADYIGGGADSSAFNNCTLAGNSASSSGGGASQSTLNNCLVYFNTAPDGPNFAPPTQYYPGCALNYCCTTPMPDDGIDNFTNAPLVVDQVGGDFHLQSSSPCINSGALAYVVTSVDLDGNPRISGGTVDIGAYEFQNPTSVISYAWLQQYGLPTDGSADFADTDGDGFNNYNEWRAGTSPLDPSSLLKMTAVTNDVSSITVTWQSVSSITYFLQSSTNLLSQPAFQTIATGIAGQAGTTSYTDTTATNGGPYFYRVGVQ